MFISMAVAAMFLFAPATVRAASAPVLRVGSVPPPLQLGTMIHGPALERIDWEHLKGKVVVLEFWNTGCGPCIEAIPHLNQLVSQFTGKPVVFVAISDDNPDLLRRFLARKPISGWIAIDGPLSPTATAFGVIGIPHTVIVDAAGKIAAITHPSRVKPEHIEEVLAGRPCSLPTLAAPDEKTQPVAPVTIPDRTQVTITGPFEKPDGAYGACSWRSNCVFRAEKAPIATILSEFFRVSPKLLSTIEPTETLYNVMAAAPANKTNELRREFTKAANEKWRVAITPANRVFDVYVMTVATTNAPAMKQTTGRKGGGQKSGGFVLIGVPMRVISSYLEMSLDKPVIDETHFDGLWAAEINWQMTPDELSTGAAPNPANVIKAAREQLGLELRPARRELATLDIRSLADGIGTAPIRSGF